MPGELLCDESALRDVLDGPTEHGDLALFISERHRPLAQPAHRPIRVDHAILFGIFARPALPRSAFADTLAIVGMNAGQPEIARSIELLPTAAVNLLKGLVHIEKALLVRSHHPNHVGHPLAELPESRFTFAEVRRDSLPFIQNRSQAPEGDAERYLHD